jgi:hypothetical protein
VDREVLDFDPVFAEFELFTGFEPLRKLCERFYLDVSANAERADDLPDLDE